MSADMSMASAKKALRASIAATLKALESAEIERQSARLAERVCALPEFVGAAAVSVYLEMPKEAATTAMRAAAFAADKKVYVPKITGRGAEDLVMVHATSMDDIRAFPKVFCARETQALKGCDGHQLTRRHASLQDKWQIPDPPLETATGAKRDDPIDALDLELVLLPGVAFTRAGGRLGHGKGYYGAAQQWRRFARPKCVFDERLRVGCVFGVQIRSCAV